MIFQCADLDRALQFPELMPDARTHAETCERCRDQLYLWTEISSLAPQLHEEWETPGLWGRIRADLATAAPRRRWIAPAWRWGLAAAAAAILAIVLLRPSRQPSRDFLTEDALQQVQHAEAAYARSIENLSRVASPELDQSLSPLAATYREKLLVLDSELAELKAAADTNRYNVTLQTQLASVYREKQKTLQEWLEYAKRNSSPSH